MLHEGNQQGLWPFLSELLPVSNVCGCPRGIINLRCVASYVPHKAQGNQCMEDGMFLEGLGEVIVAEVEIILFIEFLHLTKYRALNHKAPAHKFNGYAIADMIWFVAELIEREVRRVPVKWAKRPDPGILSFDFQNLRKPAWMEDDIVVGEDDPIEGGKFQANIQEPVEPKGFIWRDDFNSYLAIRETQFPILRVTLNDYDIERDFRFGGYERFQAILIDIEVLLACTIAQYDDIHHHSSSKAHSLQMKLYGFYCCRFAP